MTNVIVAPTIAVYGSALPAPMNKPCVRVTTPLLLLPTPEGQRIVILNEQPVGTNAKR